MRPNTGGRSFPVYGMFGYMYVLGVCPSAWSVSNVHETNGSQTATGFYTLSICSVDEAYVYPTPHGSVCKV
jgi:hypothetical protein